MSVEELVNKLRSQDHLMQMDGFDALLVTASEAADKLEELASEAHEWRNRVRYLIKCIDENRAYEDRLKTVLLQRRRQR